MEHPHLNSYVLNQLWCTAGIVVCVVLIWWGNRKR